MDTDDEGLLQDGRVRLVSEDQAENLREQQRMHEEFVAAWTSQFGRPPVPRTYEDDPEEDQPAGPGEGSQDPDDYPGWSS